jgi:glycosyltransferase involved in cell wall biosynthesis
MIETPVITVLMPVYNAGKYIGEAIASVLAQSFTDFELLIVDDASTDNTCTVISSFTDHRIRYVRQERGGVAKALNTGLQAAKGKYIARFDADDICMSERLAKQYEVMQTHPEIVITGSDAVYLLETGEPLFRFYCNAYSNDVLVQMLPSQCPFIHSSVMYRKEAVRTLGGYNEKAHNFEDHLLWMQLHTMGELHNLKEPLVQIRFNPGSVTMDERWRGRRFRALKKQILLQGTVTDQQEKDLLVILEKQNRSSHKMAAYYLVCAKKWLTSNYQPQRARVFIGKAIRSHPLHWEHYALYITSWLPAVWLRWLQQNRPQHL